MQAYFTYQAIINEAPPRKYLTHNYVWNTHAQEENTWIGQAMAIVGSIAGALSDNPVISQVGWDVLLSTLSLCLWSVVHGVDVSAMLRSSGLTWSVSNPSSSTPFLHALPKVPNGSGLDKEVIEEAGDAIEELAQTIEVSPLPVKGRGRGRPRKISQAISKDHVYAHSAPSSNQATAGASSSSKSSSEVFKREVQGLDALQERYGKRGLPMGLRRSTRSQPEVEEQDASSQLQPQDQDQDGEDGDAQYKPTPSTEKEVNHYDFDGGHEDGLAKETESGVLAWGLFVLGGLGMVTGGVLGGESSGR